MKPTKVDAALAAAQEEHANDPERAELLARARRFKSSWLELAESLTAAKRSGVWTRWGFESFEDYARVELHLRPETVEKLTGSFSFLQRRAPSILDRDGVRAPIPSYQAVDFLRRVEEDEDVPRDVVDAIHKRVVDEGAPFGQVSKQFRDAAYPPTPAERRARDVAALKNVGTRLRELLGETHALPRAVSRELEGALDRMLESLGLEDEAAA
jgi:hypothetical protein